jgi:hypothetical protein
MNFVGYLLRLYLYNVIYALLLHMKSMVGPLEATLVQN